MNTSRTDYFGGTLDEALEGFVRESKRNAVAFDDIVWLGRDQFSLDGEELEAFVGEAVLRVLKGGACAARLIGATFNYGWQRLPEFDSTTPEEAAEKMLVAWKTAHDASGFFAWLTTNAFTDPSPAVSRPHQHIDVRPAP